MPAAVNTSVNDVLRSLVAIEWSVRLSEPYLLSVRREGQAAAMVEHLCTVSIGISLFINHEASQDEILKWADAAMYQAKDAGRNLIRFHGQGASVMK